jgi:glycosyltransferase involved in cell wall biosynthesis
MDSSRVGIIIPALNEALTISAIVKDSSRFGVAIVVDDGSDDQTSALASQSGAIVIKHQTNKGYDFAIDTGFKKAVELGLKIAITLDADGQHDPSLIYKFIEAIDSGSKVVVGIRNNQQRIAERIFGWYTKVFYNIEDPLCGLKAYELEIYNELGHFDSYQSIGTELLIFASKRKYKISQIHFDVKERSDQSRFGSILFGNYKILRSMILSIWCIK